MKKWVRWWGLIAFTAVVGSLLLFWLLFADGLVRRAVEKAGTAIAGAEVNVGSADVTFLPPGIVLNDIEVTDPQAPVNNSVQIGRTAFSLDGLLLLRRKVIVNEMAVEAVRFNVPRKRPGRVPAPPAKTARTAAEAPFSFPSLELPNAKNVLATEDLGSLAVIEQAKAEVAKSRAEWQKRLDLLPDRASLDRYRERVNTLKAASKKGLKELSKSAADFRALQRDLDRDIAVVREAKRSFTTDYSRSKETVDHALLAPRDDVRRIKEKYGLSAAGLQNLSRALFGRTASSWVDTGLLWYGRLKPLMAREQRVVSKGTATVVKPLRAKGVDVRFKEHSPRPDLLVSLVKASFQPAAGTFDGTIRNITPDQNILGAPLTFFFSGNGLPNADRVILDGKFDHVHPARTEDTFRFRTQGYRASALVLTSHTELPVSLQQGVIDLDITGSSDGTTLSARIDASVHQARFETGGGDGALISAVRSSLARVAQFMVTATISGTADNYAVSVSSDLDRVLKDAVGKAIGDKVAVFEKDLHAAIQARTADALQGLQGDLSGLGALGPAIDSIEGQLSSLLKETTQGAAGKIKLPF